MRLFVQEDLEIGRDDAFREVVDLDFLERQLLRRGVDLVRTDEMQCPGVGASWSAGVEMSGHRRTGQARITRWAPPEAALLEVDSGGLAAELLAEFNALSRTSTRLRVTLDLRARRLRDRMFLHSLQLTKKRLSGRLCGLVEGFAREAERRARMVSGS